MNYDTKECGKRIRHLRIKAGLTQQRTAGALNIDRSFYSRVEAGKCGCSVDLLVQLSDLFVVSLDYLVLGKYGNVLIESTERDLLKEDAEKLMICLERVLVRL